MTTAVPQVTDEIALAALRDVVAERPEFVYSAPDHMKREEDGVTCFYVHSDEDGSPVAAGCAIGVVLHRLGVPLEVLAKEEGGGAYGVTWRFLPHLSRETRTKFSDMQNYQDDGAPWGLAYARAMGETI
ncbi:MULTISPECIES: hypothetical protein [unclassified Streptomyces]|uniref:hypothetical protein n=1 Tax=unclassified Streptomyces TaxID=2593676 RepID=UPI0035DEF6B2